ncbi:TPA: CDP-diacylglycerol--glycerol-3-phosphate 3-phosphatidyltransferase [Candidatus Woesearchaeota archaeon]|nr:CDP-diacylglycerol--glycerol-3-phosphate 3-phosphatidyltransferase [Candidatus Woesearchaeota archaeon]HII69015.1 CDP-diacylglycerol--glycerol-3-phosphate 3-phosphatidyltransferase [Candidatus Woesearchaeota archaeon]
MNLPNALTTFRALAMVPFVWVLFMDFPHKDLVVLAAFLALALTDWLDGHLARKRNQVTDFGKILDPIADKALTLVLFFYLTTLGIPLWMPLVMATREIVMTVMRIAALPYDMVIPASGLGKIKTVSQMLAIPAVLLAVPHAAELVGIAVLVSVISGIDYYLSMSKRIPEISNLPNTVTMVRFLLLPVGIWAMLSEQMDMAVLTIGLIFLGDKVDGSLAKHLRLETPFGRVFDNITDYIVLAGIAVAALFSQLIGLYVLLPLLVPLGGLIFAKARHFRMSDIPYPVLIVGKLGIVYGYVVVIAILIDFSYKDMMYWAGVAVAYLISLWYVVHGLLSKHSTMR